MKRFVLLFALIFLATATFGCGTANSSTANAQKTVTVFFKVTIRGCDLPASIGLGEVVLYTKEMLPIIVSHPQPGAMHASISEYWKETDKRFVNDQWTPIYQRQAWLRIDTTNKCSITTQPWAATLLVEE